MIILSRWLFFLLLSGLGWLCSLCWELELREPSWPGWLGRFGCFCPRGFVRSSDKVVITAIRVVTELVVDRLPSPAVSAWNRSSITYYKFYFEENNFNARSTCLILTSSIKSRMQLKPKQGLMRKALFNKGKKKENKNCKCRRSFFFLNWTKTTVHATWEQMFIT